MNEVLLYAEKGKGNVISVVAQIDEYGRLLILGDEYGLETEWEIEYCYLLDKESTKKLSVLLKSDQNVSLLQVLAAEYDGRNGCERIMEFCRENGVSYQYFEVE